MPFLNEALRAILSNNTLNEQPDQEPVLTALNALLAAGYHDDEAKENFRKAVDNQKAFWNPIIGVVQIPLDLKPDNLNSNTGFLKDSGTTRNNKKGGGDNPLNNFEALTRLAVAKRAFLALKIADDRDNDKILSDIILQPIGTDPERKAFRQKFFDDEGRSLFGPEVTIPNWNPDDDTFLDQAQFAALKAEAQRQLLIRKINACNDKDLINSLLVSPNPGAFREVVKTLFGVPLPAPRPEHEVAQSIEFASFNESVKRIAAKKGLSLAVKDLSPAQVLALGRDNLNEADPAQFKERFAAGFSQAARLHNDDINAIKGLLGARFLPLIAPTKMGHLTEMEGIAKSEDPDIIKGHLRTIFHPNNGFIDHSVNATSIPDIRKAYATQALLQKIALCNDGSTLEALTKITDANSLTEVLTNHSALGYAEEPAFREALATITADDLKPLIATAHIRNNITVSASPQILKAMIEWDIAPAEFTRLYHETFTKDGLDADIKTKITEHFTSPDNIKKAREQALLAYAKTELANSNVDLLDLVNARGADIVHREVSKLFPYPGVDNPIRDLVGHPIPIDAGISNEIRRYAAITKVINDAQKPQNLAIDDNYNYLVNGINTFTFNPQDAGVRGYLEDRGNFPAQEKQRIQGHLLGSLIRNYPVNLIPAPVPPTDPDKLTKLAKETDIEKFKQLLVAQYALTNLSWVNQETMEQVQKNACTRVIELGQKNPLRFGGEAHPKLINLISNLPLAKQRALLDNPKALIALAAARSDAEIERVLGDKNLVNSALISAAAEENQTVLLVADIANSEITKTLAQILPNIDPPLQLTAQKVADINAFLLNPANNFINADNYQAAMQRIVAILAPQPDTNAMYAAFGLNNGGVIQDGGAKRNLIDQQHQHNVNLIAAYRAANPDVKQVILALLPLSKNGPFLADRLLKAAGHEGIVTDIREAKTLEAFSKLISEPPPGRDYKNVFVPPLDQQLTPQAFARIKRDLRANAIADPAQFRQTLEQQRLEVNEIVKQFNRVNLNPEQEKKLQDIAEMNLAAWFNPAFQASSKANAIKYGEEFETLAKLCDAYVTNLTNQLRDIQEQIRSLPLEPGACPTAAIQQAVNKRYDSLQRLSNRISEEIHKYANVQELFYGRPDADAVTEPLAKKGLLKTLEQAKEGKLDSRIDRFYITSVDYDVSKRAELMAPSRRPRVGGTEVTIPAALETGGTNDTFTTLLAVPAGKIREHTVVYKNPTTGANHPRGTGCYLEERTAKNLAGQVESGVVNYPASLRLTATQFPEDENARVFYAMAMASQLVANLKEPPSAKNPIKVRGSNPVLVKYLWTALMIIGEADDNFKFGRDQIKVISGQFDPGSEYSFGGLRWSGDTKEKFTNHPELVPMLKGIKEINEQRFGEVKKQEQHVKDTSEMTRFFKSNMPKIEEQNKEHENDTSATLGLGSSKS